MHRTKFAAVGFGCLVYWTASTVQAEPILQLYLEGGTYSAETESWELTPGGSSAGEPFRLWTIGNVDGPGGKGAILDVRLSFAYDAVADAPTITLTPSTTGGYGGFVDPSPPDRGAGTTDDYLSDWLQTQTDGSSPILGDGSSLPTHGIYGPGTHWQEFALGDFTLTDSPIADFIDSFPAAPSATTSQINVYEISVLNGSGLTLHVDLYNTIMATNHAKFAPFSHDVNIVPVPSAALLALVGFGGLGVVRKRSSSHKGRAMKDGKCLERVFSQEG